MSKMQNWHCYVCGALIGKSETVFTLCNKESCARAMGIVKVKWDKPEEVVTEPEETA